MPVDQRAKLAAIKRFDRLIAYLRDEMGWPIEGDDFEDITFEYTPEELGIDVRNAAKIQEIKRLRPLAPNQPWGIFFVKFEPKRLPVVALRRILGQVTLKKRASANASERRVWATEDLLFVSNYGEGVGRRISLANFSTPDGGRNLPTLRVLGWDDRDTALHLDAVATELTEHLAWPEDEEDTDSWREQWRAAFTLRHREVIATSRDLSVHLARLACAIRNRIQTALAIETEDGRIIKLMKAFRETLVHDLDADGFADMYAQTIAYGLLSARISDPERKTADDFAGHMRTNPFLRDLMQTFLKVGGRQDQSDESAIDFDELGVSEVIELLDDANMDAVVRDFGDRNPREDPVIHFYELFLKEYDAKQRMKRGVFYTPRPVVSFIVRSVHELLRTEFGLADGLADTASWRNMAERHTGLTIPEGVSPDQDFIRILDPATGTGTFLVEVIDLIHNTLAAKWRLQGLGDRQIEMRWNEYVPKHLLTRLNGYELQMAPYAIAHLKIGLKLYETGYRFGSDERARVYLTNALEPATKFKQQAFDFAIPALAKEANAVNAIKDGQRFTIILGNPPYSGHSANKNKWIRDLLRGKDGKHLVENYFAVDGATLNERNPKWLNDDYVKFIRLAQWQIECAGEGVVGFITNHSYLDNPTFRGMRESLAATFPRAYLLDLHGNAKKKERAPDGSADENVFDIQQGVAVSLLAKHSANFSSITPGCFHADLWGRREGKNHCGKYDWLCRNHVGSMTWIALSPKSKLHLFVPRNEEFCDEYERGWKLPEVFPLNSVGIVTARDKLTIQWTRDDIHQTIMEFISKNVETARRKFAIRKDSSDWKVRDAQQDIRDHLELNGSVTPILYRPFDKRFTYYTGRAGGFICRPRPKVMRHMLSDNLALHICRQTVSADWRHCLVTNSITDDCYVSNKTRERGYTCPLFTYSTEVQESIGQRRLVNLGHGFLNELSSSISLDFICDGAVDLKKSFGPVNVFNYIYAVLHSPGYRRRYADFLKSDFPRIPLPGNRSLFMALSSLGQELVAFHLMKKIGKLESDYPIAGDEIGDNSVQMMRYTPPSNGLPGRVWINRIQYFEGVAPEIWAFAIGGYRPVQKWLKDRKGRVLSENDITHYRNIIAALTETIRFMQAVDDAIEQHGGWPSAFEPSETGTTTAEIIPFRPRTVVPAPNERYVNCAPLVPLKAAAGAFSDAQYIDEDTIEWVTVETTHRLRPGMFIAQVVGKSMEPAIPDGRWCLFRAPVEGTRQGKTVLVQLRDATDPETGQRYTVKRYESEKTAQDDSWQHTRIALKPANPDFEPIVLTDANEGDLQVIAELVVVL